MIPTPNLSHLNASDYERVYEPAEDTFLLLDALELDSNELVESKPRVCLEIGSGSGCVSAFMATILGTDAVYLCTDINPHACHCTARTGVQNKVTLDVVNTSLASPFYPRLAKSVDLVLFNPPYVPTAEDEALQAQDSHHLQAAWAGGSDGMSVTIQVLQSIPNLLTPSGRFYLIALKQNNISNIQQEMAKHGLENKVVLERRAGREHLYVLRFRWS